MKLEYLWQLIFVLVGAFASGYAGYYYANQPDENTILEYQTSSNKNLKNIFGGKESVKIIYEENELNTLSNVRFSILNNTEKNIGKFKIYFEVNNQENVPLFHSLTPPVSYPKEAVTLISNNDGVYIFEIEYLNKTDKVWNGLDFVFYFSGSEPSEMQVKTGSKGIHIQKYEYKDITMIDSTFRTLKRVWWVLVLYISFAYIAIKMGKIRRHLHREKFNQTLNEIMSNDVDLPTEEKINKIKSTLEDSPKIKSIVSNWNKKIEA